MNSPHKCLHLDGTGMNNENKCLHLDETGMNNLNKYLHLSETGMYILLYPYISPVMSLQGPL